MLYNWVCTLFSKIIVFRSLGNLISSSKLVLSSSYYYNRYHLKADEISAASIGLASLFSLLGTILTIITGLLTLLPIISLVGAFTSISFYYKIISEYEAEARKISKYVDLITEDFVFSLRSSNSIFDALKYVSQGGYPVISDKFKEIIYKINTGENPVKLLREFLDQQPSKTLKNNLLSLIKDQNIDETYENLLGIESQRSFRGEYENFTMQVESKMMMISATSIFLPLIIGLSLIFWGLGNSPLFLLIVPLQLTISLTLKKKLLKDKDEAFGE